LLNVNKFYSSGQKNQCYLFCIMQKFVQCGKYFRSHAVPPYTSFTVYCQGYQKNRPSQQRFKVFILFYIFCRYMFRPLLAIFKQNAQLFQEATSLTTDPLFCVITSYLLYMFGKFCRCLFNIVCDLSRLGYITSFLTTMQ
jgi:hypothetical protein